MTATTTGTTSAPPPTVCHLTFRTHAFSLRFVTHIRPSPPSSRHISDGLEAAAQGTALLPVCTAWWGHSYRCKAGAVLGVCVSRCHWRSHHNKACKKKKNTAQIPPSSFFAKRALSGGRCWCTAHPPAFLLNSAHARP
jgi:hypothetical protein